MITWAYAGTVPTANGVPELLDSGGGEAKTIQGLGGWFVDGGSTAVSGGVGGGEGGCDRADVEPDVRPIG